MRLDTPTLFLMTVVVTFMVGVLFLMTWTQTRHARALAVWGIAHLVGAVASALLCLRGVIPDALSIGLANALMLSAYGMIWSGVRTFEGRSPAYPLAVSGGALWCVACLVPAFFADLAWRIALASSLAGLYCALSAREILAGRAERLASRKPAFVLMTTYAALYWVRVPMAVLTPVPSGDRVFESPWLSILCFAGVLFTIAIAFTFMALIKERAEREQRLAAETDALTGLANRRAFVARTRALLAAPDPMIALVLFDLDHFKTINDTYGHAVGDGVLIAFAEAASAVLPKETVLGRMGGEEFACVIPGLDAARAGRVAERVRATVARIAAPAYPRLAIRVSAGVTAASSPDIDVDSLLRRADAALYHAKHAGRDRVAIDARRPAAEEIAA